MEEKRLIQTYKIVSGNSLDDLEAKVSYHLAQHGNETCQVHGDVQNISYTAYIQVLTGYKYV